MRAKVLSRDLKVGMVAYLPYFNGIRKAKITGVFDHGDCVRVDYWVFSAPETPHSCVMKSDSEYEIWVEDCR